MKKRIILLSAIVISSAAYSQVGINTPDPKGTLDITAKNPTGTSTTAEGIIIPRVDRQRAQSMNTVETSTMIYVNSVATGSQTGIAAKIDAVGYYYYNGTEWTKLNSSSGNNTNIYNADGTLSENRTVTQADKFLKFTGNISNLFSVDGTTFSVDALNNKVGMGTDSPTSVLSVVNPTPGNTVDAFSAGINNCGSPCGQGTARNISIFNKNGTNSEFGSIDFIPSITATGITGSSIRGIDRDTENGYAGLEFNTRNAESFNARMTIKSAGNIGVGTTVPNSSALMDLTSTTQGFLPPRLTTAQRDAIVGKAEGLTIYNTDIHCMQYWNATIWKGDCSDAGQPEVGIITTLDCAGSTTNGALTSGTAASGVSSVISYAGGNGGSHNGQTVTSTGVTGLTATLSAGNFANGSGTLTYNITGTPSSAGTASFAINIGGKTCTITRTVTASAGAIATLDCAGATNNGTLTGGTSASGVSSVISYTGGNGGSHNGQTVTSTGVTGLTATLSAGNFANGNGTLTYTISGTPSGAGTASFAISIGGQTCNLTRTVTASAGAIAALDCAGATNNGTLTGGTSASGVSSVISYTGGNGGSHNGQTVTSTGVTGLTATLSAGNFANGNGTLTYTISGIPSGAGTASFAINIGGQTCNLTRTVTASAGAIAALDCAGATNNGVLVSGAAASGVSSVISYTGGNGGSYNGQTIASTGITGLTATLSAGNFANGNGTLTYTISGTAQTEDTASFTINIGGKTCTFTREIVEYEPFVCGIVPGRFPLQNVHRYVICSGTIPNLQPTFFTCPGNTVFNPSLQQCTYQ